MGIEINNSNKTLLNTQTLDASNKENKTDNSETESKVKSESSDSVQLTNSGVKLSKLANSLDANPPFEQARVDMIKQKIAAGDYQIDAKSIAAKLSRLDSQLP